MLAFDGTIMGVGYTIDTSLTHLNLSAYDGKRLLFTLCLTPEQVMNLIDDGERFLTVRGLADKLESVR